MIKDFFGDGRKWGVKIRYLKEKKALGTAGSLSLYKNQTNSPFIVCNGDVISDIRFSDILDWAFYIAWKLFSYWELILFAWATRSFLVYKFL